MSLGNFSTLQLFGKFDSVIFFVIVRPYIETAASSISLSEWEKDHSGSKWGYARVGFVAFYNGVWTGATVLQLYSTCASLVQLR